MTGLVKKISAIVAVLLAFAQAAPAFPGQPESHFLSTHTAVGRNMGDGLPANYVDDIFRDDAGLVWIATSGGGLCRYDGYSFLTFSANSQPHLKSNFVRVVAQDRFRRLWVATEGGLDVISLETLQKCSFPETEAFEYQFCSHLACDASGAVWVKTGDTIRRISFNEDGSIERVAEFSDSRISQPNLMIYDVDGDGTVWACIGGKLFKLTPSADGFIRPVPILEDFSIGAGTYVSGFLKKENEIWISTAEGLYRRALSGGQWRHYTHSPSDPGSLSQDFVTDLAVTPDRELLVATLKGINIYNPVEDNFERVAMQQIFQGERYNSSEFINCVRVYGDQIWVGTETAGLMQICSRRLSLKNYVNDPADRGSLSPGPVNVIHEDQEGRLWVGNVESGLNIIDLQSGTGNGWTHFTRENSGLAHNSISSLCPDASGRMWVGTWGGGIDIVTAGKGRRPSISITGHLSDSLAYIGAMAMDSVNNLMWIGTNTGIFYYDFSDGRIWPALHRQTWGCIGVCADSRGRLWMGSQEGLFIFDLNARSGRGECAFPFENYRFKLDNPDSRIIEKICCITEASDGSIWLGSMSNGLYHATTDESSGMISYRNYGYTDGLSSDIVKGILEDESGDIWVSTVNGLSRLTAEGNFINYSDRDGLYSHQFYWNAACRTREGDLCFGQVDGLTVIDPHHIYSDTHHSPLRIINVTIDGKSSPSPYIDRLRLHERNRSVEIEFSALTFDADATSGAGDKVHYSYLMEGIDRDWVKLPPNRHHLLYTSMHSGKYRLHLRAFGPSGVEISRMVLPITVKPYFYNTWWFYLAVVAAVAAGMLVILKVRLRNLERQRQELQAMVEERTKEISRQNRILTRQIEELASHQILLSSENRDQADTPEDLFITKALQVIREHYKDTELDVTAFCSAMGMSKTYLNTRMQEALGQSIGQFIRTYRLSIAKEMLINNREDKHLNISEIAYECGFNDPKYFTRCFTKEFGISPAAFQKGSEQ